jgi:predicted GNAT family acetyltransferase
MEGVLALLRSRGETLVPVCSWAAAYLRRHPEHQDLLG